MNRKTSLELVADDATQPAWKEPVSWRTRWRVRHDVVIHRNFSASMAIISIVAMLALMATFVATAPLVAIDRRFALIQLIGSVPLIVGSVLWYTGQLLHRMTERAASATEVTILRSYSPAREWAHVQASAVSWRAYRPRDPITMAIILRWQDDAAAKEREALPPTIAEQAANRAQERAFD